MKKNDDLKGSHTDEEEDLFDLSLDDLEPEDTIIEAHVDETDDEIIELIDLVEKGDIDLLEEDREPGALIETIQEFTEDEIDGLKTDKTLDLLSIPLDQALELDHIDDLKEAEEEIGGIEISDVTADLLDEKDLVQPADTIKTTEVFFDDIADESALKELIADEIKTAMAEPEIEGGLFKAEIKDIEDGQIARKDDRTIRIYPPGAESPEPIQGISPEEPGQPALSPIGEEPVEKEPAVGYMAPVKEEAPQMQRAEAIPTGISEEKVEAVIRKAVEDTVERFARERMTEVVEKAARDVITEVVEKTARETMTEVIEKTARETMTEVMEKIARETMAEAAEKAARESMAGLMERISGETAGMMEKIARDTTASVAERVITDAINILKNSIESSTD